MRAAEPPARLHGDLWSGNVMADAARRPWLIDPSAYGGHREVDLAMLRLFGAPSERMFAAYEEVPPLADGWRERVELYQLLPLLVHALLFGGSYARRGRTARLALRRLRRAAACGSTSRAHACHAGAGASEWGNAPETVAARRRLYLLARVVIARHYRQQLTLAVRGAGAGELAATAAAGVRAVR